jgi:hypothetical protein
MTELPHADQRLALRGIPVVYTAAESKANLVACRRDDKWINRVQHNKSRVRVCTSHLDPSSQRIRVLPAHEDPTFLRCAADPLLCDTLFVDALCADRLSAELLRKGLLSPSTAATLHSRANISPAASSSLMPAATVPAAPDTSTTAATPTAGDPATTDPASSPFLPRYPPESLARAARADARARVAREASAAEVAAQATLANIPDSTRRTNVSQSSIDKLVSDRDAAIKVSESLLDDLKALRAQVDEMRAQLDVEKGKVENLTFGFDWLLVRDDDCVRAHVGLPREGLLILMNLLQLQNFPALLGDIRYDVAVPVLGLTAGARLTGRIRSSSRCTSSRSTRATMFYKAVSTSGLSALLARSCAPPCVH